MRLVILFGLAATIGCGARTIGDMPIVLHDSPQSQSDSGTTSVEDTAPTPPPYDPARVAALAAPCNGTTNLLNMHGFFSATVTDGPWSASGRSQFVTVSGGLSPHEFEMQFSSDGLDAPLEKKLYTDAVADSFHPAGHPYLSLDYNSYGSDGEGWFQILELEWSIDRKVVRFKAVFEVRQNIYTTEDTKTYGCVHFIKP